MSMEQNEHQVTPPTPASQGVSTASDTQSAQTQQRRRRRRRKTGKATPPAGAMPATAATGAEAALENGSSASEQSQPQAAEAQPSAAEPGRGQGQDRGQDRDQRGDQRPRQARPQGQPQQSNQKKQMRPGKSGAPGQGRHFSKGAQSPPREHNPGNGFGQGSQGGQNSQGGRRKNKVRRAAPSFVGPMDHSYRIANGNIADGPPSTMDFRREFNGNGNAGVNGRNGYSDFAETATPAVLREDAPVRIVCFIEDLFVVAKMQETARKLGVKVSFAKAEKDTVTRLTETPEAERPSLIVFDLNNANAKPLTLIPKLKSKLKRGTSVIGFLSHIQGDLKVKAIEAGCDMVMPKSAFSQNLPNLLRRHGLDEELEAVEV